MKTSLETVDDVTVRLTVDVEPERVKRAFDHAARSLAEQVRMPGFRPGKTPRRLLEQRFGKETIAQTALENSITDYYVEALRSEQIEPVAQPELDVDHFDEHEGCSFTATVEVRPTFDAPDHTGIAVEFPDWEVSDASVDEQIEALRERFAELEEVDREAVEGDMVTLDLTVTVDGEVIEDAQVEDALYEVGSGGVTPRLDEELAGKRAGDEVTYDDEMPEGYPVYGGRTATFEVHITDVRAKVLPDLDDDFAMTASSFDTLDELRADIRRSLTRLRIEQARHELRGRVLDAYLARVDVPLPPRMIDGEVEERFHRLEHQAEQFGMDVDDLLTAQGTSREEIEEQARTEASSSVKARIVLDRLAEKLQVGIEASDLEQEIARHAQANQMAPNEIAQIIQEQGSLPVLVGDIQRRKTIDAIVDAADVTGTPPDEILEDVGLVERDDAASGLIVPGRDDASSVPSSGGSSDDAPSGLIVPGRE